MSCMVVDLVANDLARVHERIAGRFTRAGPRARVRKYLTGLVAGLERTRWQGFRVTSLNPSRNPLASGSRQSWRVKRDGRGRAGA